MDDISKNVYEGYRKFKESGGLIRLVDDHIYDACVEYAINLEGNLSNIITIKEKDIEIEIKSFMHELLHLSDKYRTALYEHSLQEEAIENEVETVYAKCPEFVDELKQILLKLHSRYEKYEKSIELLRNLDLVKSLSDVNKLREVIREKEGNTVLQCDGVYNKLLTVKTRLDDIFTRCSNNNLVGLSIEMRDLRNKMEDRTMKREIYEILEKLSVEDILHNYKDYPNKGFVLGHDGFFTLD